MMGSWDMAERLCALPPGAYIPVGFVFPLTYCLKTQLNKLHSFFTQRVTWGPHFQKQDSETPLLPDFRNWVIRLQSQGTQRICDWLQIIEPVMVHRPAGALESQGGKMARKQKRQAVESTA